MTNGFDNRRWVTIGLWGLAFGYFLFYIPYSALVKALTSGMLQGSGIVEGDYGNISGLEMLPAVLIGTAITMPLILFTLGWYRYMGRRKAFGFNWFVPSRWSVYSGVAFAVIIATTTLAYSFHGVSIVLALLLMRGGVLVMSPIIDRLFSRPVHWFSWAGLGLSVVALLVALIPVQEYTLTGLVLLNLSGYLLGYAVRLRLMTRCAKDVDETINRRFFVEENTVAMVALIAIPGLIALFKIGDAGDALHAGFTTFFETDLVWPALLIGVLYGCLGIFGRLIYLNRRENTFVIPVNRCSSLLSGLVATLLLVVWADGDFPSAAQLFAAAIIVVALAVLAIFDTRHMAGKDGHNPLQRVFLFVCDFNRSGSPMAAAICNAELEKRLNLRTEVNPQSLIYARSAGLHLPESLNLHQHAGDALRALTVPVPEHQASLVNSYGVHRAEKVVCMTDQQREELIERFPWAVDKTISLNVEDFPEISEAETEEVHDVAQALSRRMAELLEGVGLAEPKHPGLQA